MTTRLLLITGILFLFATEILRVYFIMPFPGSQHANTIDIAYFIDRNRMGLRIIGILLIAYPASVIFLRGKTGVKILLAGLAILYGVVFYMFNFRFEADKMFYQPQTRKFRSAVDNKVPADRLVIGVVLHGEARAFPIQVIGYHHQVRDTIGGEPVMVTYCTVCRTGRVFSPLINGVPQDFRLVGMDHFNAMFEDSRTRSWWQQATGVSIAGPLKNTALAEIPSSQTTLSEWLKQYPDSKILQPDTLYKDEYEHLAGYDKGTIESKLERRDSASWKPKSWVIGVRAGKREKAYDWEDLISRRLIQDTIGNIPVLLLLGRDSSFYHVWNRNVQGQTLSFEIVPGKDLLQDSNTNSVWDGNGKCISGDLKDRQLEEIRSYQEFWHSWGHFHPATGRYMH
jgi:hypothetical protein